MKKYKPRYDRRDTFLIYGSPLITPLEKSAVLEVMRTGWIGTGPKVAEFEQRFGDYIGASNAVALNSCSAALHLAMIASGVGPGDEVITTPMTFCATANAIIHSGARPVFVDIDSRTLNIDHSKIADAITPKTRLILPVHFGGRPCDMKAIMAIAEKHNLLVIEDAAHAIEAAYRGKKVGTIGDMTCFSFYVTKNIHTGEGGMVTTNTDSYAEKIKILGLHGMTRDAWHRFSDPGYRHYEIVYPGFKYNMTDIHAAMGLAQLPNIDRYLKRREHIWQTFSDAFSDLPLTLPSKTEPDTIHARHLYTVLIDPEKLLCTRDEFIGALEMENIGSGVHYISLHRQPYYRDRFHLTDDQFPAASSISDRIFSLPLSPKLTDRDVEDIIQAVKHICEFFVL